MRKFYFDNELKLQERFLRSLSTIKSWSYDKQIESEKKNEINLFLKRYVFDQQPSLGEISYNKLQFLFKRPQFNSLIKATIVLMENSENELDFHLRFEKVNKEIESYADDNIY